MLDRRAAAALVLVAACSGGSAPAKAPPAPADAGPDASLAAAAELDAGELAIPKRAIKDHHRLALMLMSTPSGANVAVDHQYVGKTPVYWEGEFTGGPRTFTFWLAHYKPAEYTFVPTTDGFVHPRLEPGGDEDAGVPTMEAPPPDATVLPSPPDALPPAPLVDAAPQGTL